MHRGASGWAGRLQARWHQLLSTAGLASRGDAFASSSPHAGPQTAGPAAPPQSAALPPIAAHYQLDRLLGRGSAGEVRLATDVRTGRPVAIKLLAAPTSAMAGDEHWTRELAAARRLQHPGIAAMLDAGQRDGKVWLVMEFAPGTPLSRYTQPPRLLPEALVLRLGAAIAEALAHAHAQRVVHRDLKPANVLVDLPSASVKLLDFGVARIDDGQQTHTGMTLGTPAYMAPEQMAGLPASSASDVYALGVVLFELLSGRRPHEGASLGALLRAMATEPPAQLAQLRPDLPEPVNAAVQQAMQADPAQRPLDLLEFARRLQRLAHSLAATAPSAHTR